MMIDSYYKYLGVVKFPEQPRKERKENISPQNLLDLSNMWKALV